MINWHFPNTVQAELIQGDIKTSPEDFEVTEVLGFDLTNEGEHVFVFFEKKNLNTEEVTRLIAKQLALPLRSIGYSGLKDKQAITRQWISFPWPIKSALPDLSDLPISVIKILRHNKKLKKGAHIGNHFQIKIRNIDQVDLCEVNLKRISHLGVPNYFGAQRFGYGGQNINKAQAFFERPYKLSAFKKGLYLSAVRSYLFNHYLASRVMQKNWDQPIPGDIFNLQGSNSIFEAVLTDDLNKRIQGHDIHPVGPLFGYGESRLRLAALKLQETIKNQYSDLVTGIVDNKIQMAYRPLRLLAQDFSWYFEDNCCILNFELVKGAFATSVLKEVIKGNPYPC